jgi:hypothetical protein
VEKGAYIRIMALHQPYVTKWLIVFFSIQKGGRAVVLIGGEGLHTNPELG